MENTMTEKLYYSDSHMKTFTATVLACSEGKKGFEIILDRTAFFPEGGGQSADTGVLGGVEVTDVHEKDGQVVHYTKQPLTVGDTVSGEINWAQRFLRMQLHSGEHVVSGIIHNLYGYENVGFHMNEFEATFDAGGELDEEQVRLVERMANQVVWENVPVRASFPEPEVLKELQYRSKLDLTENVRIVEVEGYDRCACCAPHVNFTGEIGQIRLLTHMRHRGGTRMTMVCGSSALAESVAKYVAVASISASLSVKHHQAVDAVEKLKEEAAQAKYELAQLRKAQALKQLEGLEYSDGNLCLFAEGLDTDSLRGLVNCAMPLCGGIAAAFSKTEKGWNYIMGSNTIDLRAKAKEINAAISGKGGGSSTMIQGSCTAEREEIENNMLSFR